MVREYFGNKIDEVNKQRSEFTFDLDCNEFPNLFDGGDAKDLIVAKETRYAMHDDF